MLSFGIISISECNMGTISAFSIATAIHTSRANEALTIEYVIEGAIGTSGSDLLDIANKMKSSKNDSERFLGYTKLAIVGKGAFGTAVLYKREVDKKEVVIKEVHVMNMPLEEKKSALNEVKVLSALNHPHIIRYFGSFEKDGSLFIEMEYADGGTLAQFLNIRIQEKKRIKEQDVLFLFRQITGAIGYMHQHKILHRDLKTANIFLTKQFICKVGDFGISKMMTTLAQAQTVVGTPYYLSPEMCEGKDYDEKSDIWALGCILYEMIELRKPFEAQNLPALVTKITACDFEPISRKYSNSLQQLINSILQKNSVQRPSAQTIHACIIPQMLQDLGNKESDKMVLNNRRILTERSVLYEMNCFKNEFSLVPVKLPTCKLNNVAVGSNHCLAVTDDCLVYSWGDNRCGQLGLGELAPWRNYPIRIDSLTGKNIKQIAAGCGFSVFLNNIGLLMSCGDGRQGCLGHGDWNSITQPRINNRMISVNIVQVKCGPDHVMALSVNGDIYAWGCGKSGRLGLGDEESRCSPTFVKIPSGYRIKKIFCGGDASIALTSNGQLLACGLNTNNKLGLSSTFQHQEKTLHFTPVKSIKCKIKDVSMGNYHTILITEDGNAITMGRNNEAQLGRGHCKPRAQPEEMNALRHKIMVADCGSSYSIAGTLDNVVYFWGTRYDTDNRKSHKSAGSHATNDSAKPLKQTFFKVAEGSFSSNSSSVSFSSDIVKNCDLELIKTPKAVLGLYASPQHIAAGELVWLVNIFCFENSIFVWVNTTVPAPTNEEQDKASINQEMVSKWMDFETLKREITALPNTPQPNL